MADLKPVYKRINGAWVKQTAYQRQSGEWVQISAGDPGPYQFADGTLTIREDDGSLEHKWSWGTMQYDVEAKK